MKTVWKKDFLRLSFTAWSHFTQLSKLLKANAQKPVPVSEEVKEKVIIKQRLEVYDGTMEVWATVRQQIVAWVESIYSRCNSYLDPSKK